MKKTVTLLSVVLALMLASFTAGMEYQRGDVDQNGSVDISDVTCLINYLLYGTWLEDPATSQIETFTVNGVSFNMVTVEGGTFMMGASDDDEDAYDWEYPNHEVTLSQYSIGQTEVTQELWLAVMGSNPSYHSSGYGYPEDLNRPVEYITWNDCQTFITKLNELTGKNFRLPTEAQWEFAARGGNLSQGYKYAGSNTIDDVAWYYDNSYALGSSSPDYGSHAVATKAPNELGLYDMSGNVFEWVHDWFGNYGGFVLGPQTDPTGPNSGYKRVERGGCNYSHPEDCRVSYRYQVNASNKMTDLGFRLAL